MERPRIKPPLTTADRIAEAACWLLFIALWVIVIFTYNQLPSTIPTHYNFAGEADGSGSKATILVLPVLGTISFAGLTALNWFPHVFNYPATITAENAEKHYTNATRMIRYLKLSVIIVIGLIELKTVKAVNGNPGWLGIWLLPVVMGIMLIPAIYFVVRTFRIK